MTSEELFDKWYPSYWAGEPYTGSKQDFFDCFKAGMKAVLDGLPEKKEVPKFYFNREQIRVGDLAEGHNDCIDKIREKFKEK